MDAARIHGLMSRGEAGHGGLGEGPVGDADARVGGLQHCRLMQVHPRAREHLVGQLAAARRVGEVLDPVRAYTAGEGEQVAEVLGELGPVRLTAIRLQVLAGCLGRLGPGSC